MTSKDYQAFAAAIAETHAAYPDSYPAIAMLTGKLADIFAGDNWRFDRTRFYYASWPDGLCRYCGQPLDDGESHLHSGQPNNYPQH